MSNCTGEPSAGKKLSLNIGETMINLGSSFSDKNTDTDIDA